MIEKKHAFLFAIVLIAVGMIVRFIPHAANMTPMTAVALFAGVYLPKRYAIAIPLAAMVLSDIFIGFHNLILVTWGSFVVMTLLGMWLRKRKQAWTIAGSALAGSVFFFLVTNWAVMQFDVMYPHSLAGLMQSYVAGIPFFRNMLIGDLVYTALLFGVYEAVLHKEKILSFRRQTVV
ncbi:MAG: DUF6580 family putative transport protein [Patescibacteria group bacterium]|jgi:hypothetical protein